MAEGGSIRVERSVATTEAEPRLVKPPKTQQGYRTVSLPAFAARELARHRAYAAARGQLGAPVFCVQSGPGAGVRHYSDAQHWAAWRRFLRRAGVSEPRRRFHALRHTHASQLLALGVPLTEVARRLGDRPETVLKRYAHWLPSPLDPARLIEERLGGGGGGGAP